MDQVVRGRVKADWDKPAEVLPGMSGVDGPVRRRCPAARSPPTPSSPQADTLQADYAESSARVKELSRLREEAVWAIDRLAGEVEALRREVGDAGAGAWEGQPTGQEDGVTQAQDSACG